MNLSQKQKDNLADLISHESNDESWNVKIAKAILDLDGQEGDSDDLPKSEIIERHVMDEHADKQALLDWASEGSNGLANDEFIQGALNDMVDLQIKDKTIYEVIRMAQFKEGHKAFAYVLRCMGDC